MPEKRTYQKFDALAHKAIKIYSWFLRKLSLRTCLTLGRGLGHFLYLVDFRHRKIALANLRFALGDEKDEKTLQAIAKAHFQQLGMTGHEWLRFIDIDSDGLQKICRNISVEGEAHLMAAKKKSPTVILVSAHYGNFEYAHIYYATHYNRLNFIVRRLDNNLLEKERLRYNHKANVNILYKENGLRPALKNLKKGEDIVIFADRKTIVEEGLPLQFFGKKTSTLPVAVAMAKKFNIPMVPMFITRCKDTKRHKLIFYPMFTVADLKGDDAVEQGVQIQNDKIEAAIRQYPDQWLWIHRKWKCYHSHIYE